MTSQFFPKTQECEIAIIGGGIVGAAVGYGLVRQGKSVSIFDEGDVALRASRGNFGLIWVQGKGGNAPAYARWTQNSARAWQKFDEELTDITGVDLQRQQKGGLIFCEDDEELQAEHDLLCGIRDQIGSDYPFEVLDNAALRKLIPEAGPTVPGATWCPDDGHVNPLYLMRSLHQAFQKLGGRLCSAGPVSEIAGIQDGFEFRARGKTYKSEKIVLAAGLGNKWLAPSVGLNAPVEPNRGQVLITERLQPFLKYPTVHVRQTGEGTIQIGDSKEDAGYDTSTSLKIFSKVAKRAVKFFPLLEHVRMVRAWGALRIMSPDGLPIYEESKSHPGAYVVSCHSGVTLASLHAGPIADWVAGGTKPQEIEVFNDNRF